MVRNKTKKHYTSKPSVQLFPKKLVTKYPAKRDEKNIYERKIQREKVTNPRLTKMVLPEWCVKYYVYSRAVVSSFHLSAHRAISFILLCRRCRALFEYIRLVRGRDTSMQKATAGRRATRAEIKRGCRIATRTHVYRM